MPRFRRTLAIFAVITLLPATVCAQPQSNSGAPKDQNAPEHFDSQSKGTNRGNESLTERLDRTDGVIKPPADVGPKIHETPPPTGDKDIVIPPPPPGSNPAPK